MTKKRGGGVGAGATRVSDAQGSGRQAADQLHAEQLLERRVEERTRELTALLEVSRSLSSTLTLEPLLDLILDQLLRVIDYRGASIIVVRDDLLETVASRTARQTTEVGSEVGYSVPLARALPIWQAVLRGEPVVIGDVRRDDLFARTWRGASSSGGASPVRAWLGVPLSARGQVFGFLALTRDVPDSFTDHEIDLAVAFAGHAAVAIDNAGLLGKSEQRARELTALLGVAASLASTIQLEPLLDVVLDQIKVVAEYVGAVIVSHDGDSDRILRRRAPTLWPGHDGSYRVGPSLSARVSEAFSRREAVIIDDFRGDGLVAREFRADTGTPLETSPLSYVRSWMTVPLALTDRVIGEIVLTHSRPGYYTPHHAALVTAIAAQAAAAIENARLFEEQRRTAQELATLLAVARSAASTLEPEPLLNNILDTLKLVVDYDGASIGVVDGDEFRFLEARGASSAERRPEMIGVRLPMRDSALWEPLFRHEPVIMADIRDDSAAARAFRRTVGEYYDSPAMRYVRSFMAIPLVNRDRLVGLLTMSSRERGVFTERHAGLAMAIATHIAAALENARLFEEQHRTAQELGSLLEVSRNLGSTLELEPLLDVILDQIKVIADYDGAGIRTYDGDTLRYIRRRAPTPLGPSHEQLRGVRATQEQPEWEAINRREPVIIDDVRGDDPLARAYRADVGEPLETSHLSYVRSCMAVPLTIADRVIGLFVLAHGQPGYYTPHHAELVSAIATQAAAAIENAQLYEQRDQRANELATLLEVSHSLASTLELKPLVELILDQLKAVADYTSSSILMLDGDEVVQLSFRWPGISADQVPEQRISLDVWAPIWEVIRRREPVIVADVRGDSPSARVYQQAVGERLQTSLRYVRSWMAVPITRKDRVVGMITLSKDAPDFYTPRHAGLATAIASQAAMAIENARLLAESERRAREMTTLVEVSRAVTSTLDLSPLLNLILEQLKTVVDYRGATLGTIEGEELLIVASRAVTPERSSDRGLRFPLRRFGPIWEAIGRAEPAIIADVRGDEPAAVEYRALNAAAMDGPTHRDIRSWMAVPLVLGERVIGMLSASQDVPNYFTAHHADLALAFANQVTVAIENARLFAEAEGKAALEERQRLARELHDSVSQALFGIALGAGAARRRLELDPARVGESIDYVLSLAEAALTEMRALIFELRPETLEKDGLVVALTRHAAATHARHELAVETALCEEPDVPLTTKEALYRIAQEAMHNAVKHARATRIDLVLAHSGGGLCLEVRDNGVGFDPSQDFAGHLGLHSMRERMAGVGGTTDITSIPGKGTSVLAAAPCG